MQVAYAIFFTLSQFVLTLPAILKNLIAMALPAVQQAQAAPQIIYDWDRNLYLVALVHGSCAYYFPICPGMFAPGPQYRLHSEPSRETVMTDIPPPAIAVSVLGRQVRVS